MAIIGTRPADSGVMKNRRRTTTKAKRPSAPKVSGRRKPSSTKADTKIALLKRERDEALEREKGTAEILRVISSSAGQLEPVFQAVLENAVRICDAKFGTAYLFEDNGFRRIAVHNAPAAYVETRPRGHVLRPPSDIPLGRIVITKRAEQVADARTMRAYIEGNPFVVSAVDLAGYRTVLAVPMLKDNNLIGAIVIHRQIVSPFTNKQIALVESFATQAVIAVENTRLLNELHQRTDDLTESLEQQTATSEVLSVISNSPGDLEPVFETMLASARRICKAEFGILYLCEDDGLRAVAMHNVPSVLAEARKRGVNRPDPRTGVGLAVKTRQPVQIPDLSKEQAYLDGHPHVVASVELGGIRTTLNVPMLKEDQLIGAIVIYRQRVQPFEDKQIELVQNFAAQAVIAIENTRLLNELRESLQQQTATSEVLSVISSSPGELKPVFDAMLQNTVRICDAKFGNLWVREGDKFRIVAIHGASQEYRDYLFSEPLVLPDPQSAMGRVATTGQVLQIDDISTAPTYGMRMRTATIEIAKARTLLAVPMLKDNEVVGIIGIYRQDVRAFTDKQIALVQNFAAQAVIAIENTRLLNELRQRTDDLTESLEQQTATSEVLRVISSSPGELEPVFQAMLESSVRICEAKFGQLYRFDGRAFHLAAGIDIPPDYAEFLKKRGPFLPPAGSQLDLAMRAKRASYTADMAADATPGSPARLGGARSAIAVPMLKDDGLVGAIIIYRQEVRPFTDKQIELVENFAAQAVIAIENTRLLNELRESLQQQTATADLLKVISRSTFDLQTVFDTLTEVGRESLCGRKGRHLSARWRFVSTGRELWIFAHRDAVRA